MARSLESVLPSAFGEQALIGVQSASTKEIAQLCDETLIAAASSYFVVSSKTLTCGSGAWLGISILSCFPFWLNFTG
jgi:hypothetical protein